MNQVLLSGGGDSIRKIVDITSAIPSKSSQISFNYQVVVLCGKNDNGKNSL